MSRWLWLLGITGVAVMGCRRPEKPWQLPDTPEGRTLEANLGSEYDTVAFISLELGEVTKRLRTSWDLALRPRGGRYEIRLNAAMYAFAVEVSEAVWQQPIQPAQLSGWRCDLVDTAALQPLHRGEVRFFVIDRDRGESFYRNPQKRYRKVAIRWEGPTLSILSTALTGGDTARWRLPVDTAVRFIALDRSEESVSILPSWRADLILTRYIHPFYDQPEEFRWYPVLGALIGENVQAAVVRTSETPYEQMNFALAQRLSFSDKGDVIGYDWKRYDFSTGTYVIDLSRYFVLKVGELSFYKLRFIDFYDTQGRKGCVRIEYEPI
ncbi:MAG: HmuY family protein [Bacteroidia bacterium]|nr:HmuY family protein [Bacteroidia bacterium]MCX7651981.1 HmuY family protein [Bacteroidia bacterium]MDW8417584.1 HmuY family protein [Bacteroidia bacterium]